MNYQDSLLAELLLKDPYHFSFSEYLLIFLWCRISTFILMLRWTSQNIFLSILLELQISSSERSGRCGLYSFEKSFFTRFSKLLYQVCDICSIWENRFYHTWIPVFLSMGTDLLHNWCIRSFSQETRSLSLHIEDVFGSLLKGLTSFFLMVLS